MKLALPLVLLAAPAFAECPTAADMERGVVVTYDDGRSETVTRDADGWVEVDSGSVTTSLIQGLYWRSSSQKPISIETADGPVLMPAHPDSTSVKMYDDPVGALPAPEPDVRIVVTSSAAYMPMVFAAEEAFVTGPLGTARIGACDLAAFTVDRTETLRIADGTVDDMTRTRLVYLADLGFAISTSQTDEDGGGWEREPVAIEAAP